MVIMYAELPPVWGDLSVTGGFRSVVLQRRPDKGGLVCHLTWCSAEKVYRFHSGTSCQSVFFLAFLCLRFQYHAVKKYYFVFKAKSRLGRYIFKIKVKYLYLLREIPSDSRQTSPPKQIIYNTKE